MMFFYVDESGNTGTNLFDENQPHLYYGVLSARKNLDALAKPILKHARRQLGVERLHASELGLKGLVAIADDLVRLQKRYRPRFDIYRVAKPDHAVITFFDQVFDQGMNPAMTWTGYWTPIRYALLVKVAMLFDHELSRLAWRARINIDDRTAEEGLVNVCHTLLSRLPTLPDARSRQLIGDTLSWAIENVGKLNYNCKSPEQILDVTPNMIGFQSVMHGIASRLASPDAAASIIVDRQSQFNKAQQNLAAFFAEAKRIPWLTGVGLPEMDLIQDSRNTHCFSLRGGQRWLGARRLLSVDTKEGDGGARRGTRTIADRQVPSPAREIR